jgi:hypothetical protein
MAPLQRKKCNGGLSFDLYDLIRIDSRTAPSAQVAGSFQDLALEGLLS